MCMCVCVRMHMCMCCILQRKPQMQQKPSKFSTASSRFKSGGLLLHFESFSGSSQSHQNKPVTALLRQSALETVPNIHVFTPFSCCSEQMYSLLLFNNITHFNISIISSTEMFTNSRQKVFPCQLDSPNPHFQICLHKHALSLSGICIWQREQMEVWHFKALRLQVCPL